MSHSVKLSLVLLAGMLVAPRLALPQVIIGPQVGVGIARSAYTDPAILDPVTLSPSRSFGFSIWTVNDSYANIMADLHYREASNEREFQYYEHTFKRRIKNEYLNMPVRITLRLKKIGSNNSIHFYAGPEVSYWMGGNIRVVDENNTQIVKRRVQFPEDKGRHRVQYGFQTGLTWLNRKSLLNWACSIQYSQGITRQSHNDVVYVEIPDFSDTYFFRNQFLMFTATYYFGLKKNMGVFNNKAKSSTGKLDL